MKSNLPAYCGSDKLSLYAGKSVCSLHPLDASEIAVEKEGDDDAADDDRSETVNRRFHTVQEVHAEEAGNQCGKHEDDAHRGHRLHRLRHVVVDDAGVGLHGGIENVRIDARCLACLTHLDVHVFNQVGIKFVDRKLHLQLRK